MSSSAQDTTPLLQIRRGQAKTPSTPLPKKEYQPRQNVRPRARRCLHFDDNTQTQTVDSLLTELDGSRNPLFPTFE